MIGRPHNPSLARRAPIPLVFSVPLWLASSWRKGAPMPVREIVLPEPPRRIALVKPSALGDIMHSLPVLSALRRRFPDSHITWVVNRIYEPLLRPHPDLDAVLPFDRSVFHA